MRARTRRLAVSWLLLSLILVAGWPLGGCSRCGAQRQTLEVFAASSLTEAFEDLERAFEADNPETDVSLTLAGSQVLRLHIEQGADADVFASANPEHLQALVEAGRVRGLQTFAYNELVVIVPTDNPAGLSTFSDLPRAKKLVVGTRNVPVGSYAREALHRAGERLGEDFETDVLGHVVSEENNVRLVRAKVELGEADAAIVYRTDAAASDRVRSLPIPEAINVRADYPIGIVEGSDEPELAQRWIDFVLSEPGQRILAEHGFVVTR